MSSPAKKSPAKPSPARASPARKGAPTKFGVQAEKAKVIYCFTNGDKHHKGVKLTINAKRFKTFDQLKELMSREVGVPTGAVRKVYTPEGKLINSITSFEDGGKYICAGAEALKKDLLPLAITNPDSGAPAPEDESPAPKVEKKGPVVSAYSKGAPKKFGLQSEKAKVIYCFRNGDKHHKGVKIMLHPTKFKTFEQVKLAMTREVQVKAGTVRKVWNAEGKIVKDMAGFTDGGKYVCGGAEAFDRKGIPLALTRTEEEAPQEEEAPAPKVEKKGPVVSAYSKGAPKKFGLQSEKAKVIYCFRNGDKHHKGVKITLHPTKFKTFEQVKLAMTREVQVKAGTVRKVWNAEGKIVKDMAGFLDGAKYVCGGAEAFDRKGIPLALTQTEEEAPQEEEAPAPKVEKKGPVVSAYSKGAPTKFGLQGEKARIIYVFRNGDKHHSGMKMAVHRAKFKNLDQLKEAMNKQVGVVTGSVRQIFTVEGKLIKSLEEIQDETNYVCCGAEKLDKEKLSPTALIPAGGPKEDLEAPKEETQEDKPKEKAPKEDKPKEEAPTKEEKPKEETPKEKPKESLKEEKPKEEIPKEEKPKEAPKEAPKETPKEEAKEAPKEAPKEEAPKEDAPKEEKPKEEAPKEEKPKEEAPKEEKPKEEAPKEEAVKEEAPKEEAKEEAPKEEVKEEAPKEAAAKESPKESPKEDTKE